MPTFFPPGANLNFIICLRRKDRKKMESEKTRNDEKQGFFKRIKRRDGPFFPVIVY